jgi:hypothetical protein
MGVGRNKRRSTPAIVDHVPPPTTTLQSFWRRAPMCHVTHSLMAKPMHTYRLLVSFIAVAATVRTALPLSINCSTLSYFATANWDSPSTYGPSVLMALRMHVRPVRNACRRKRIWMCLPMCMRMCSSSSHSTAHTNSERQLRMRCGRTVGKRNRWTDGALVVSCSERFPFLSNFEQIERLLVINLEVAYFDSE